jgi:hypothetical protein
MTDAANTPRTAAGRAHFQTFVDNQHHDNVDAAYECSDDVDRCDFCAQEADDIIAIEAEARGSAGADRPEGAAAPTPTEPPDGGRWANEGDDPALRTAAPTPEPRCPFVDERDAGQHVHCSLPAFHSGPHDFAAPTPAERREALRELSLDADDLGIYVEPEGLDVLARVKHEETEGYGLICKHSNQHLRGKECGPWALRFVAEYDRLMRERQP